MALRSPTAADKAKGFWECVSAHSFNKDATQVAVSPSSSEIWVYDCSKSADPEKWVKLHTLTEHSGIVSDLDWSPVTNRIVSCSHDRNAYVWAFNETEKKWNPTLCMLRINRAALSVKWSPTGDRFAVGTGCKTVPICNYEPSSDWWVSRLVKKHKSSIVDLAWSPNGQFLITASCDGRARVVSVFDKKFNQPSTDYSFFGDQQQEFGEVLVEFPQAKGWVNTAAWSPDGTTVAFGGHGSSMHFATLNSATPAVQSVCLRDLPFLSSAFVDNGTLVAAGFDKNPTVFARGADGQWALKGVFDKASDGKSDAGAKSAMNKALAMFQQADSRGAKFGEDLGASKKDVTTHKNTITQLKLVASKPGAFSTSGLDGRVTQWSMSKF